MKHPIATATLAAMLAMALSAAGATYTWNGAAGDGDWTNASNWDGAGVPPVNATGYIYGSSSEVTDIVIATTGSDPASNIPDFANKNADADGFTPHFDVRTGSSLAIYQGATSQLNGLVGGGTMATVADGASLTFYTRNTVMDLVRHPNNTGQQFDIFGNLTIILGNKELRIGNKDTGRVITMNLDGGSVELSAFRLAGARFPGRDGDHISHVNLSNGGSWTSSGYLYNMWNDTTNNTIPTLVFDFADTTSSVTNVFGGNIDNDTDLAYAISNGVFTSTAGLTIVGSDNGDGTFTVTAVPEPSTSLIFLVFSLALLRRRRKNA